MEYRREIDGLRALAVLPVILFHAGFETFGGGFVGVDVFFVISGYLITTIILAELKQGSFSIVNFYERRARRILPALFIVMLACVPLAWMLLLPHELKNFSQSLMAVSVFASNILFWRESGYFDTAAELKPLLHTWSLAVEEQYYVLFPLFMIVFWRIGKSKLFAFLGIAFITSLALAEWTAYKKPSAAFYLLPTRGWELLIGAFAAFYLFNVERNHLGKGAVELGGWLGLALILVAIFSFSKDTPFPGVYALVPTLGTALVIMFTSQDTSAGKFLCNKAFVGIGLVSYAAYLWHQPLFAFAKAYTFNQLTLPISIFLIFLTFFLSFFSQRVIEAPFRKKEKYSRNSIFLIAFFGSSLFFALGFTGQVNDGFPGSYQAENKAIVDWAYPGVLKTTNIPGYYKFDASKPIDVLFFGDSHAEQFAPLSSMIALQGFNVGFLTSGGCAPIKNYLDDQHRDCFYLFERLDQVIASENKIKHIFVAGFFNLYLNDNPGDSFSYYYIKDGKRLYFRDGNGHPEAQLSLMSLLHNLSTRANVVLIGDNPQSDSFDPAVILEEKMRGDTKYFKRRYPEFSSDKFLPSERILHIDLKLRGLTPPSVSYLSLVDIVCPPPSGLCKAHDRNGDPIYKDTNHMRPSFVTETVGPYVLKHLR